MKIKCITSLLLSILLLIGLTACGEKETTTKPDGETTITTTVTDNSENNKEKQEYYKNINFEEYTPYGNTCTVSTEDNSVTIVSNNDACVVVQELMDNINSEAHGVKFYMYENIKDSTFEHNITVTDLTTNKEIDNFNFKHYVRHISQLVGLQDRYAKAMEPFDLERGKTRWQTFEDGKPPVATDEVKRHQPLRAWRQQMIDEIKLMEQKLKVSENLDEDIGNQLELLQQLETEISSRKGKSKTYKERLDKLRKECDALIGKKASLQSEIKDLEKDMEAERSKYTALQKQADALAKHIEHRRNNIEEEIWGANVFTGKASKVIDALDETGDSVLGDDDGR